MKYDLKNKFDLVKFNSRSDKLKKDEKFVELKVIHPTRSDQQNKYFHVLVGFFAAEYGETLEHVKQEMFKKIVNRKLFLTEYVNKVTGELREAWRSSKDLDTGEMTIAIERFRNYASKEAGIYLPEPNEEDFLRSCEIEIEKNKHYL